MSSWKRSLIELTKIIRGRATEFYEGKLGLSGGEETEDGGKTYRCGHGTTLHIFPSRYIARSEATRAGWEAGERFEELIDELTSSGDRVGATYHAPPRRSAPRRA